MKLKLVDTILLALMVAVLMIASHQIFVISQEEGFKTGFLKSYWIFMILFVLTVIYQKRKNKAEKTEKENSSRPSHEYRKKAPKKAGHHKK